MKGGGNMDIMKSFNLAIDYIEDNLTDELDEKEITRITGYSFPMFSRIFSIVSGYSLSEYIRLRKMTNAAIELKNSDKRIIDIAIKYGYNSQDSFTLAFKSFHKLTPGQVKKGEKYQYFPRIYFSISVQGGNQMDIKIEKKKAFKVAGIKSDVTKSSNFPKEGYRHDESPDFEVYGDGDPNSEDYQMELWVPILRE